MSIGCSPAVPCGASTASISGASSWARHCATTCCRGLPLGIPRGWIPPRGPFCAVCASCVVAGTIPASVFARYAGPERLGTIPALQTARQGERFMLKHAVAAVLALAFVGAAQAGKTLDDIKKRGQLVCGVNPSLPGFSAADSQGNWAGLDVDVCKALAATVLNDASKIKWVPLNASQRFAALQSGEVDILSRNTTWTLTRDASLGLHFTGT